MNKIQVHTDQIITDLEKNINLVVISDIHINSSMNYTENFNELIKILVQLNPDYILVPGDIIQSYKSLISKVDFIFSEFGQIAPTIICLGNHELEAIKKGLLLDWFYNLERFKNVYPLNNASITLDKIQFTGFSPSLETYFPKTNGSIELFSQEFANSDIYINPNSKFNIMLTHNPNFITDELLKTNSVISEYDLFVCGHNHNGCVPTCIEKLFKQYGILGPYFTLFQDRCRGIFDVYNSKIFVSKGYRKFTQENIISSSLDKLYPNDVHQLVLKKKN